jgi:hypothetical protein
MPVCRSGRSAIAVLALLVVGCSSGGSGGSVEPSTVPSVGASAAQAGGLPPGCELIDMHRPNGERLVLDGTWFAETHTSNVPETWWIRTLGNCLWGAGAVGGVDRADLFDRNDPGRIQTLRGTIISQDFAVEGEIVRVGTPSAFEASEQIYSPIRLLIDFDADGSLVLREDRVFGETAPFCAGATVYCMPILVLRPAE